MSEDFKGLTFNRKHRPNSMLGYIGNERAKLEIKQALKSSMRRPQYILFDGDSGCGKTTFARIVAKEYSCENRNPETGACGVCPSCLAYNDYISTGSTENIAGLREINMASDNGKRDIEAILEDVYIPSFGGQWKIYIFDECHKATIGAQNSLLKITEEPPENVLFCLCTTNPEELIPTLRNRANLNPHIKKPTVKELSGLLEYVCNSENINYDLKGLNLISARSDLVIRQSLTELQKCYTTYSDCTYASAVKMFDEIADKVLFDYLKCLRNKDTLGYVRVIYIVKSTVGFQSFISSLRDFINRGVYIYNGTDIDGMTDTEVVNYKNLFCQFSLDELTSLLTSLCDLLKGGDIEVKLLSLGYSGLDTRAKVENTLSTLNVVPLESELLEESHQTSKIKEESRERLIEQGLEIADEGMKSSSFEDILSTFGNIQVVSD